MIDSWNAAQLNEAVNNGSIGGTSLPEVTSSDNGDVLTVVEGVWNKATPVTPSAGYAPNYSETEAEVGSMFGENKVYGRLIPLTTGSITTSDTVVNSTLTFEDVNLVLLAQLFFTEDDAHSKNCPIQAYIDQRSNGDHKLHAQAMVSCSLTTANTKYIYIEYTKFTPAPAE